MHLSVSVITPGILQHPFMTQSSLDEYAKKVPTIRVRHDDGKGEQALHFRLKEIT